MFRCNWMSPRSRFLTPSLSHQLINICNCLEISLPISMVTISIETRSKVNQTICLHSIALWRSIDVVVWRWPQMDRMWADDVMGSRLTVDVETLGHGLDLNDEEKLLILPYSFIQGNLACYLDPCGWSLLWWARNGCWDCQYQLFHQPSKANN